MKLSKDKKKSKLTKRFFKTYKISKSHFSKLIGVSRGAIDSYFDKKVKTKDETKDKIEKGVYIFEKENLICPDIKKVKNFIEYDKKVKKELSKIK